MVTRFSCTRLPLGRVRIVFNFTTRTFASHLFCSLVLFCRSLPSLSCPSLAGGAPWLVVAGALRVGVWCSVCTLFLHICRRPRMLSFLGAAFSHSNPTIKLQQLAFPLSSTAPPLDGRRLPRVCRWGYRLASPSSDSEDSEDTKRGNAGLNPTTMPFVPVLSDDPVTAANRYQWHVRWDIYRPFNPTKMKCNPTAAQMRAGQVQFGQPKPDRRPHELSPEFGMRRQPG